MRLTYILTGFIMFLLGGDIFSQNEVQDTGRTNISGYIQAQFQHFNINDSIGAVPHNYAFYNGGAFVNDLTFERFMIRRGRLKISHQTKNTLGVISFDITEKSFAVKDLYLDYREKLLDAFTISAGIFNRPFGYELSYSSGLRESPERSRVIQTLFPGERDLGVKFNFRMPESSFLHFLVIEAGVINGNGAAIETDNYKDIALRTGLQTNEKNDKFSASLGFSYYKGYIKHIYEPVDTFSTNVAKKFYIYTFEEQTDSLANKYMAFTVDTEATIDCGAIGGKVMREYYGIDGQVSFNSPFGKMVLRGEYITGIQPSSVYTNQFDKPTVIYNEMNSLSPTGPITGVSWPVHNVPQPYRPVSIGAKEVPHNTMIRKFQGGYFYFIQNIMKSKHQLVLKYEWYDPNTEVKGEDIYTNYIFDTTDSLPRTYLSPADIKYTSLGIGWNWQISETVKLMVYYENQKNENSNIIKFEGDIDSGWYPHPSLESDIQDDILTIRLQYKF